jgi:hypothetical protein
VWRFNAVSHVTAVELAMGADLVRSMRVNVGVASAALSRHEDPVHRLRTFRLAAVAAFVVLATACEQRIVSPSLFQPQVINVPNEFILQATSLDNVTDDKIYTWQNDSTTASVSQLPEALTGEATLVVYDAAGNQVYQHSLGDTGQFKTTSGPAGLWSVRLRLADATGAFTFRLEKPSGTVAAQSVSTR